MYMMKLEPEQVVEMYQIREALKKQGIKYSIAQQVRDAIKKFTTEKLSNLQIKIENKEFRNVSI